MARIFLSAPDVGPYERVELFQAFDKRWIALGPDIELFEKAFAEYVGLPHAVALSSGTAALHLAMLVNGVGPGDTVITSTLTFAATANPITYVGAIPVFVDADPDSWTMSYQRLEEALDACKAAGRSAKAVISVDLYGQSCDYEVIAPLCQAYGASLIDDAAEAVGATYKGRHVGNYGVCAAFSFNGNKIMTSGGGGMLVSHDADVIARARHLSTQARDAAPHYEHSAVGYNYRMSNLLAALGRSQLGRLDRMLARRREINNRYRQALATTPGITFMPVATYGTPNCWLTCIQVDPSVAGVTRDDLRVAFEAEDIEARPLWKPLHLQPVFQDCRTFGGDVAADLFDKGLCLPSGSGMSDEQQDRVLDVLAKALKAPERSRVYARRDVH